MSSPGIILFICQDSFGSYDESYTFAQPAV